MVSNLTKLDYANRERPCDRAFSLQWRGQGWKPCCVILKTVKVEPLAFCLGVLFNNFKWLDQEHRHCMSFPLWLSQYQQCGEIFKGLRMFKNEKIIGNLVKWFDTFSGCESLREKLDIPIIVVVSFISLSVICIPPTDLQKVIVKLEENYSYIFVGRIVRFGNEWA